MWIFPYFWRPIFRTSIALSSSFACQNRSWLILMSWRLYQGVYFTPISAFIFKLRSSIPSKKLNFLAIICWGRISQVDLRNGYRCWGMSFYILNIALLLIVSSIIRIFWAALVIRLAWINTLSLNTRNSFSLFPIFGRYMLFFWNIIIFVDVNADRRSASIQTFDTAFSRA